MHPRLLKNLESLAYIIGTHDYDGVIIFDGEEGSGKTSHMYLIAHIFATLLATKTSIDTVNFDADAYRSWAEKQKKGTVGIFDEARRTLNKLRTMGKTQVEFTDWMSWNRDLNMVHLLALPYAHDLVGYITHARMKNRGFILHHHVFSNKNIDVPGGVDLVKGWYSFHKVEDFIAHISNPKSRKYTYPKGLFVGRMFWEPEKTEVCTGFTPAQLKELMEKKRYWRNKGKTEIIPEEKDNRFWELIVLMLEAKIMKQHQICRMLNIKQSTFSTQFGKWRQFKEHSSVK